MSRFLKFIIITVCIGATVNPSFAKKYPFADYYKNLQFKMPKVLIPNFPSNVISVSDCGGIGDGMTLNTKAFEKAMETLSAKGGGTLEVPFGVWYTGPIVFRSNINLHLQKGALLLFTPDMDAYPLISASFEGLDTKRCQSPVSGKNLENIAITGEGAINGSGEAWRPLKKGKVTESYWKSVINAGGFLKTPDYWFPTKKSLMGEKLAETNLNVPRQQLTDAQWDSIKDFLRPVMVSFVSCKNIYLQGVLFENSPSWNIHPLMCENIIIDGVFIRNPAFAQNGDGLDLESCKNALIINTTLDVGDDAICLKSGKDEEGRKRAIPTENVIVDNCKVFKGHGGFVVGSEMSGGVRNVSVSNCKFMGTDVGLRFKSSRGRGGIVENIYINKISMFDIVTDSFLFDLYYGGKSASESLEDGTTNINSTLTQTADITTPVFRNIFVKNIVSRNARRAMFFNGLPEMNITNIHVENAEISSLIGAELCESNNVFMKNVHIRPTQGPALILNNVHDFKAEGLSYPTGVEPVIIKGSHSKNIDIQKVVANKL